MGANEKAAAAYHGYTPDTEQVRDQYTREQPPHIGTVCQKTAEFERWLEQVKREAKAEALGLLVHDLEVRLTAAERIPKEWRSFDMLAGIRVSIGVANIRAAQMRGGK